MVKEVTKQYTPSEVLEIMGNELYEIRILTKFTKSIYTKDIKGIEPKIKKEIDDKSNAYFTLNQLNPAVYGRVQSENFCSDKKMNTTSDNDVLSYRWLLVDLDPLRPTGTSSSDSEKEKALKLARIIYKKFESIGMSRNSIVIADSGNGYHLLIRVDFENSEDNIKMVKDFLNALDFFFSTKDIQVDVKNFNPSRITKLYGTISRKGSSTGERPHRLSNLIAVPEQIEICSKEIIERIIQLQPKQEPIQNTSSNNANFDANRFIEEFIQKHGIRVISESTSNGKRRMVLDECPFDSSHKHDSMIGVAENKPFFSCFHNGCRNNHWREFRLLYEPNFEVEREEKKQKFENSKNNNYQADKKLYKQKVNVVDMVGEYINKLEKKEPEVKKFEIDETKSCYTMRDGYNLMKSQQDEIQGFSTGFKQLDDLLEGGVLAKGTFTIISGDNASGKSTFVNQLVLNVTNQGYKSLVYSGELVIKRFTKWLIRQASGTQNMAISRNGNLYVPDNICEKIVNWTENKIFLYNNKRSQKVSEIIKTIIEYIEKEKVDLIVIDNLMSMETEELGNDFGVDKQIIKASIEIAVNYNVHIILIAHPRKAGGYLRKNDISGEKNIANLADNIFIMHRVNDDFIRAYYEFKKGKKWFEGCNTGFEQYGNILEICKNRDNGMAIDKKVPFYFDVNCNRFLESEEQKIVYEWERQNHIDEIVEDLEF